MDEFKPEDELKPDASDRRPTRPRKSSSAPKVPVSRQHVMMGVGILVLLLLVLGIGSALKGPAEKTPAPAQNAANNGTGSAGGEKNIDLSASTSMTGQQQDNAAADANTPPAQNSAENNSGRDVSMPPIASAPTQAQPVETPANQQRVTVPGDLNTALNNQQGDMNSAAQGSQAQSSLPTAPATVSGEGGAAAPASKPAQPASRVPQQPLRQAGNKPVQPAKPAVKEAPARAAAPANSGGSTASSGAGSSMAKPGGNYTLQLSSASRSDTLNAWAKQHNLSGYHVYKTTRNGQPRYVLVSGSYATPADAKRAVASMPAAVRAQNPWVKPVSQVKKESGN